MSAKLEPKRKQFPKRRGVNGRWELDKEKLRRLYLASPFFDWKKFCELHDFNPSSDYINDLPIKQWRREWIEKQHEDQLNENVDAVIDLRANILARRVKSVKQWGTIAENLKAILTHKINVLALQAQHDINHQAMIQRGDIKPKFDLGDMDGMMLAKMALHIQELDFRTLLVTPKEDAIRSMLPQGEKTPEQINAEVEAERLRNEEVALIGEAGKGLKPSQITEMLAKWYDNHNDPEPDSIEVPDIETEQVANFTPPLPAPEGDSE